MARRYINTSQFNPYTFQELWQPAEAATQAHIQQATAYSQLGAQAAMLGDFIDPERDPEEYAAWNEFTTNLRKGSDNLMRNGLTSNTYNTLWRSTVDYAGKIKPIELAVENKQKFAQMINQTSLQHPNALFVKDVNDYSLKDYKQGIPQPELIDMDAAQKEAATIAAVYANDKIRFEQPQQFDRFRQIITQKYGDSFDEAMMNMQDPNERLYQIKQMVMASYGADRLLDNGKDGSYQRLDKAVDNGILMGAVGKRESKLDDSYFKDSMELARFNYQRARDAQADEAAAMAEQSAMINSLVWETAPGAGADRRLGWGASSSGNQAKAYQEMVRGRLVNAAHYDKGDLPKKFKVYDMKGNEVKAKDLKISKDARDCDFGITFEGFRKKGMNHFDSSPNFLMKWNGKMYRVSADALGLDNNAIEDIEYIFGNSVPNPNNMSTDAYIRRDAGRKAVQTFRNNPMAAMNDAALNNEIQGYLTDFTISAQKALFALAKPYTTQFKLDE